MPSFSPNGRPDWRSREWLESNGIGGFASGTLSGAVSRRYHAFLCAATRAPQERAVMVTKIDEIVRVDRREWALSVNFWHGSISPDGDRYLTSFQLDPLPRWIYEIPLDEQADGQVLRLEKTVWMPRETNATVAQYRVLSGPDCQISIRPFVTGRDYHSTHCANPDFNSQTAISRGQVTMRPYPHLPAIHFLHGGEFEASGAWYRDFEWPIEIERGLDAHEDAWSPGTFSLDINATNPAFFAATTHEIALETLIASGEVEVALRAEIGGSVAWDEVENRLRRAADQPIVRREDGLFTTLAGYHWFTDWGRDTMIALPGLCLTTGRFEVAASILRSFALAMSEGMIPNRFPDAGGQPDYNTVDATLWFFHAVAQYGEISGDWETVQELYPALCESLEWHLAGTRYGIVADPDDGLLRAGDAHSQLTWMDAKIGDVAFTPRFGKAVEIQALWHNALCELANLAHRFDDEVTAGICLEWVRKVEASFANTFWNPAENCLFDCVHGDAENGVVQDGAIRPNQIYAVALSHRLLSSEQEKAVVEVVERELLTPHGLRSLSPRDSRYRGTYSGDSWSRDSAYHQGTVWAWPVGGFFSAYLRVHEQSNAAKTQVRAWMEPLIAHLDEAGFGSISEIFDGDAPHAPRGCIAQAWSVSELLRVWKETEPDSAL